MNDSSLKSVAPAVAVLLLLVLGSTAAHAQDAGVMKQPPVEPHILVAEDYDAHTRVVLPVAAGKTSQTSASILVDYQGFSAEAQQAFQYATDLWERHIESPVPIRVRATWTALDENVLGSAGPSTFFGNFTNAPQTNTWYPLGLAQAIAGQRFPEAPEYDIHANFSSSMSWYFGTDGNTPAGMFDLVTVVLHEIGHGLGFIQTYHVNDGEDSNRCPGEVAGQGCWGLSSTTGGAPLPAVFDRFVVDENDVSLLDQSVYGNPSRKLGDVLQSGRVRFDGPSALSAHENVPIDLYSPSGFEPASSIAHLDESTFPRGDINSLMTPRLARAEAIHTPGPIFCGILEDLGWTLGDGCWALITADIIAFDTGQISSRGRVQLNWTTGPDAQLSEFVIQGSHFGREYEEVARIDFVPGQRDYSIFVEDLAPGRYTFRIRYERVDGSNALSRTVDATVPLQDQVLVKGPFPNPMLTSATVRVQVRRAQKFSAFLYDAMGRKVLTLADDLDVSGQSETTFMIERGSLSSGVYFLQIVGSEFNETTSVVIGR